MTHFANSRNEALNALNLQAHRMVGDLILASEVNETVAQAMRSLDTTGSAYLGGLTVQLTRRAADRLQAERIQAMSPTHFAAFARGL